MFHRNVGLLGLALQTTLAFGPVILVFQPLLDTTGNLESSREGQHCPAVPMFVPCRSHPPMTTLTQPLRFSRISLGCVTFGREIDPPAAFVMLDHAFALGITHFDTAAAYAAGESERVLGAWLDTRKP